MMAFGGSRNENNSEMLRIDMERITHDQKQLERIATANKMNLQKNEQGLRETLLLSSKLIMMTRKNIMNYRDTPEQ